jgi:phosphoribosylamine--glycine ligase
MERPGDAGDADGSGRISISSAPAEEIEADLFVIGPEAPLVSGLADRLRSRGSRVVGPGRSGAALEGSKTWMKEVLNEAHVPTALHGSFSKLADAKRFLARLPGPYVIKTDGLAGGKGVLVTESLSEAEADLEAKLSGLSFGDAGKKVVVEECLAGEEVSLMVLCDGARVIPLALAQDFKRLSDGDHGPNTGGMGAISPVWTDTDDLVERAMEEAVEPLVHVLRRRGIDYRGVLYAGLMLTPQGPKILEYNVRFGDPEAQVVLPRLDCDLAEVLLEVAEGHLRTQVRFIPDACVCIVIAAAGYPSSPKAADLICGLETVAGMKDVAVFHGGTALDPDGRFITAGGRVLSVTAMAPGIGEARTRAYGAVEAISWPGAQYRRDIGSEAARRSTSERGHGQTHWQGAVLADKPNGSFKDRRTVRTDVHE